MADSTAGGQDDATRINGLMASLGKRTSERDAALARVTELEERLQAHEPAGQPAYSQPELEEGVDYRLVNGELVAQDPPTPIGTSPARERGNRDGDDGSVESAQRRLARALGGDLPKTSWP